MLPVIDIIKYGSPVPGFKSIIQVVSPVGACIIHDEVKMRLGHGQVSLRQVHDPKQGMHGIVAPDGNLPGRVIVFYGMVYPDSLDIIFKLIGKHIDYQRKVIQLFFEGNGLVIKGVVVIPVYCKVNINAIDIGAGGFYEFHDLFDGCQGFVDIRNFPIDLARCEVCPGPHAQRLTIEPVIIGNIDCRIQHLGMFPFQYTDEIITG